MSSESQLVIGLWDAVRDFIPANKRADAAVGIMTAIQDFGIESSDLGGVEDEDDDLNAALKEVFEDAHEEIESDYDE